MLGFLLGLFRLVWLFEKGHQAVVLDNRALRQQLSVYKRRQKRPRLVGRDRWFWIALSEVWTEWRRALCIVHPDTSGALAARKIRTGAAFKQIGTGRASPQFSHSHIDSHFGGSQSLVACAPHSWRTEEARNRGLRTDGVAHPADRQAATLTDLENLPTESCRRDRRDRFLHGADDLPAGIVRVPGDRASAEKSSSLWGQRTSNRRMDRSASYRSFF